MLVCAGAERLLSPGLCLRAGPEFMRLGGGQTEQRRCRWSRFCYVGNITSILNHFLTCRTNTLDFREREKTFIGWMNKTQTDKAKVCFSFQWTHFLKAVQAFRCSFPLWRGHFSSRFFITLKTRSYISLYAFYICVFRETWWTWGQKNEVKLALRVTLTQILDGRGNHLLCQSRSWAEEHAAYSPLVPYSVSDHSDFLSVVLEKEKTCSETPLLHRLLEENQQVGEDRERWTVKLD